MPIKFPRYHNRSQQALDDSQASAQRTSQYPQLIAADNNSNIDNQDHQIQGSSCYSIHENDLRAHFSTNESLRVNPQSSTQSHTNRNSAAYSSPPDSRPETAEDSISIDDRGDSYRTTSPAGLPNSRSAQQDTPLEQKKRRFGSGWLSKGKDKEKERAKERETDKHTTEPIASFNTQFTEGNSNIGSISRHVSKLSKSGSSTPLRSTSQSYNDRLQSQQPYLAANSSELHLPSPPEVEDDNKLSYRLQDSQSYARSPGHQQSHSQTYGSRQLPTVGVSKSETEPSLHNSDDNHIDVDYNQRSHPNLQQYQQRIAQQQALQHSQRNEDYQDQPRLPVLAQGATQDREYDSDKTKANPISAHAAFLAAQDLEHYSQTTRNPRIDFSEDDRINLDIASIPVSSVSTERSSRSPSINEPRIEQQGILSSTAGYSMNRRSTDAKGVLSNDARAPPPGYSQQFSMGQPSPGSNSPQGVSPTTFRQLTGIGKDSGEQGQGGRHPDSIELDKLTAKYKKVKTLYFEKSAQVVELQNTVANQRLSASRTSLDDSEYSTRFNRLDGAIKELAFSIRKDWARVPNWLSMSVNADAKQVGTKEMTAVGRASICKWLFDEIFCKCFHPGLNMSLSADLRRLELNIREFAGKPANPEEETALSNKVVQWKLTTVDALADRLTTPEATKIRSDYTKMAIDNLTAHLVMHLNGSIGSSTLEGSATSIIELAVGICTHLSSESREIAIALPSPGSTVDAGTMKVELGLPDLETSIEQELKLDLDESEKADAAKLMRKQEGTGGKKGEDAIVRFAGFMSIDIKGKHSLIQAPVWTF